MAGPTVPRKLVLPGFSLERGEGLKYNPRVGTALDLVGLSACYRRRLPLVLPAGAAEYVTLCSIDS